MKRIILILILAIFVSGCNYGITGKSVYCSYPYHMIEGSCCMDADNDDFCDDLNSYKIYYNENLIINYPSDWTFKEDYKGTEVIFISPLISSQDQFAENVNIMIHNISDFDWDIEQYTLFSIHQIVDFLDNGFVLESRDIKFSEYDGHYLLSIHRNSSLVLQAYSIYTIMDGKVYLITYVAEEKEYEKYIQDVRYMIDTFKIG